MQPSHCAHTWPFLGMCKLSGFSSHQSANPAQDPTLKTSSNFSHLTKAPPPNIITLGVKASTWGSWVCAVTYSEVTYKRLLGMRCGEQAAEHSTSGATPPQEQGPILAPICSPSMPVSAFGDVGHGGKYRSPSAEERSQEPPGVLGLPFVETSP